ncbi:MAG: DUF3570 domain-containing protein [Sandaracinaceae bacterium]
MRLQLRRAVLAVGTALAWSVAPAAADDDTDVEPPVEVPSDTATDERAAGPVEAPIDEAGDEPTDGARDESIEGASDEPIEDPGARPEDAVPDPQLDDPAEEPREADDADAPPDDEGHAGHWLLSFDVLGSTDTDNVEVVTPQLTVRRTLDTDGSELRARVGVDVVSAASVDVVSQATAGFLESREEATLGGTYGFPGVTLALDYRFSIEPDYISNGVHAGMTAELLSPDTVLAIGYGATYDLIGLAGTSMDVWQRNLWNHRAEISLTQTFGPQTLLRAIYTLTVQDGFLEKAYRYVPLFTAADLRRAQADGVTLGLSTFDAYRLPGRVPENIPDLRVGHAVGLRWVQFIDPIDSALRIDAQLYVDAWSVVAFMSEPTLSIEVGPNVVLAPFGRFYIQSGASFWQRVYEVSSEEAVPTWRTLNRELSPYFTATGGARFEWRQAPWMIYVEGSVAYTAWSEFLFLNEKTNLIVLAGVRWTL